MSMDEQFEQMGYFREALIRFNERLDASMRDLEAQHVLVSPSWQDSLRLLYDAQWEPLDSQIKHYLRSEGPGYVEFLSIKHYALQRYLFGD